MNKFFCSLLLFFISFPFFSQTKDSALRDAKITANATLNSDFKTVLKYTLPSIVELMGGEEAAISTIKTMFSNMKEQGFSFEKSDVITVSDIVNEDNQYRCFVQVNNVMKMPTVRIKSKSSLLGIYDEKGEKWWFLEAERIKNKALLEQIIPGFKTSLKIPEDKVETEKID